MNPKPTVDELDELLNRTSTNEYRRAYVTVNGCILPELYLSLEKSVKEFEVFDSDIWICGHPKTGTTWISEIAWLIANDFDYEGAKAPIYLRTVLLEAFILHDPKLKSKFVLGGVQSRLTTDLAKFLKHPRTIKSHLPFKLLPEEIVNGTKTPKVMICTARNPMDTCVSYYHHCKNNGNFSGTFEEFCKLFLFDKANYGPYHSNVLSYWEQRDKANVLFLTYEEMKTDLPGVIEKVSNLLGKTITESDNKRLQEHVSFESMKKNPAVNKYEVYKHLEKTTGQKITPFIRSGIAGDYKNVMSSEMIEQFTYWMKKKFENSGLDLLNL